MLSEPFYTDESVTVYHGDCIEVLRALPDSSVDSVVTDPPYGIRFMGKAWDGADIENRTARGRETSPMPDGVGGANGGYRSVAAEAGRYDQRLTANQAFQAWCQEWASECLRVLKPGGHMLVSGGTRTFHRLAAGIEDAGFEIRDSIAWLYGSGFPKSLDVSKAIDKAAGVEREKVPATGSLHKNANLNDDGWAKIGTDSPLMDSTNPATPDAQRWQGWGTALKPAFEPIVVARKPLAGTVSQNVLAYGTGALNVDSCRVGDEVRHAAFTSLAPAHGNRLGAEGTQEARRGTQGEPKEYVGRWPSNVVLDDSQATELDRQSGNRVSGAVKPYTENHENASSYQFAREKTYEKEADSGGASRFFPVFANNQQEEPCSQETTEDSTNAAMSAASQSKLTTERTPEVGGSTTTQSTNHLPTFKYEPKAPATERPRDGLTAHPTVKPLDLMRWLVRLVTPPGGTVLEPFAGSGTTAEACVVEGFQCIAIEREADYLPLIVQRLTKPIQVALEFD